MSTGLRQLESSCGSTMMAQNDLPVKLVMLILWLGDLRGKSIGDIECKYNPEDVDLYIIKSLTIFFLRACTKHAIVFQRYSSAADI